ncbi:conserved Plasmodium protein, unknown function [Plasmodium ovale wallikeri]|uniref:SPRY domain, putative n=2 Tax=Plasmodium ovale TaxID=36330 RepID=A0A1C3KP45_PLAOA|nr:conserved Plasmodium protein, unknown function [Plasmodium ovale wallikeri]SBT75808.1 SPRY domain, putative [Plasmodium ovale]
MISHIILKEGNNNEINSEMEKPKEYSEMQMMSTHHSTYREERDSVLTSSENSLTSTRIGKNVNAKNDIYEVDIRTYCDRKRKIEAMEGGKKMQRGCKSEEKVGFAGRRGEQDNAKNASEGRSKNGESGGLRRSEVNKSVLRIAKYNSYSTVNMDKKKDETGKESDSSEDSKGGQNKIENAECTKMDRIQGNENEGNAITFVTETDGGVEKTVDMKAKGKKVVKESAKEAAKEAATEAAKETAKEAATEAATDAAKEQLCASTKLKDDTKEVEKLKEYNKEKEVCMQPEMSYKKKENYKYFVDYSKYRSKNNVTFSTKYKDSSVNLSNDKLTCYGDKGWSSVFVNNGADFGKWYYEIKVEEPIQNFNFLGYKDKIIKVNPYIRVGFACRYMRYDYPIGTDKYSYCVNSKNGKIFNNSISYDCMEPIKVGDIIGCYLNLKNKSSYNFDPRSDKKLYEYLQNGILCDPKNPPMLKKNYGSSIFFSLNGQIKKNAFVDIYEGFYHPSEQKKKLYQQSGESAAQRRSGCTEEKWLHRGEAAAQRRSGCTEEKRLHSGEVSAQ